MHEASCIKFFNALEEERPDCTFVYATHNTSFAYSRKNKNFFGIYYNKDSHRDPKIIHYENNWIILCMELMGCEKALLIVEGKNTDSKFYQKFFNKFTLKSGGGCFEIERKIDTIQNNPKIFKEILTLFRQFFVEVIGLIDRDKKIDEDIEDFEKKGLFVIPFGQIEHFYVHPTVLKKLAYTLEKDINVEQILIKLCKKLINKKNCSKHREDEIKKLKNHLEKKEFDDFFKFYREKDIIGQICGKFDHREESFKESVLQNCHEEIEKLLNPVKKKIEDYLSSKKQ